ncbi:hypothetical protein BDW59DRAFT_153196 [Aspergillus cavernicola]|uniref:AB hydrolase-1 domain-containing protein n=1 Tax=Aspergillus cavernicola TaxID=176166 RepID=A0ABR4HMG8_9EURO
MKPFQLTLSNKSILAGIRNIPSISASPKDRPLIVGLHGGTYDSGYFDANETHSASHASSAFGVPFVAIDRPSYSGTSSLIPIPEGSDFPCETGLWLHKFILPALWSNFGVANQCNCIVLLCHSMGTMGGVVAAAMHAQDETVSYPLGGIIVSGLGDKSLPSNGDPPVQQTHVPPNHGLFPVEAKDSLMFRPGTVHPEILALSEQLNVPSPLEEAQGLYTGWVQSWRERWAANVVAPVMFALVEQDCFFEGTEEHLKSCVGAFTSSIRVDGSLVRGAPHCMELSYWSQGRYARSFGFAMECAASFAYSSC